MIPPNLLFTFIVFTTTLMVKCYDKCSGNYCPPPPLRSRSLFFKGHIAPIVGQNDAGCFCREDPINPYFALCYGRSYCPMMPRNVTLQSPTLKLTNTHIMELRAGDFENLSQLTELQIEGNYNLKVILNGTFENLKSLVNLTVSFNTQLVYLDEEAFRGLENLENLFLNSNAFTSLFMVVRCLGVETVPNLKSLILDANSFVHIGADDFHVMKGSLLTELSLNLCRIEFIHPEAFAPLANLEMLHIGENIINSSIITNALNYTLQIGIDLKCLALVNMGFKKAPPKDLLDIIAKSNVTELNLSKNQFEVIDKNSFPYMPNLVLLNLKEVFVKDISGDAFDNFPNLRYLFLCGNRLYNIPNSVLNLSNLTLLDMQENSPGDSFHVYFNFKRVEFTNMTMLKHLNMGFNGLAHLFNTSFIGLTHLEELVLKNSSVFHIESGTFVPLENLRLLVLDNNLMVHEDAVPDVFFSLTKLEVLTMRGCGFKYITNNPFRNLKLLRILVLERNELKTLGSLDFASLISLTDLDLSFNLINTWEQRIFQNNTNLSKVSLAKNKIADISLAMLEDFEGLTVNLDMNAIICKCFITYNAFKKWREKRPDKGFNNVTLFDPPVHCVYPEHLDNVTVEDFLTKRQYGPTICSFQRKRIFLLLPLIILVVFFIIMGFLAFWYRWHIKYWIFLTKLYLSRKGKIKPKPKKLEGYTNYVYDAFVSYSTEDREFVANLVTIMEEGESPLRLCVYERDFEIGSIISESIVESIAKSRKTIIIISENYVKSQWCRWESLICEYHRLYLQNEDGKYVDDSLILIKLTPVSEKYLTPMLKYLLKTRIYLQWVSDENKQSAFWNRLRKTLRTVVPEPEITKI
ncbi:toll-like receptor 4 [Anthonomus grandis grandis]|uniref:toll-like receptor 4 n=1 Tax=Anthonomus grandis grandis TaxID=2921223 RepID=UPI002165DDEB|nr:toll-like receptor 4 [Anthonomus grandis grandis]